MIALCFPLAIALAAAGDVHLQALVPTSGSGAEAVLDGKSDTHWQPEGTPSGEGILFRFEETVTMKAVEVTACKPGGRLAAVFDGYQALTALTPDAAGKARVTPPFSFRSLFLRVEEGDGCIAEVSFVGSSGPVRPPRTVHGKVTVSSVLAPADAYHPGYLFDGRTDFGWVEGSKGTGEGEWLELTFDAPLTVTAFEIWNGYQRSDDHYQKNCRPKRLSLGVDAAAPIPLALQDAQGPQKLVLPKPAKGQRFKLTVDEVYRGSKYTDMVVSELRPWDEQGPLQVATDDMKERTSALLALVKGQTLEELLDQTLSSVCDRGLKVKLRSNHTFAIYEDSAVGTRSVNEVVDGAWIVKGAQAIELFGRRQRTTRDDRPYGDGTSETIRITGGQVTVTSLKELGKEGWAKLYAKWSKGPARRHVACAAPEKYDELVAKKNPVVLEGTAVAGVVAF